jgi:tRNA/rRNA methyltransferase
MAGTDHAKAKDWRPQPAFVLVRPQMGENIGAAARAMWNFGLEHMTLVAPRDGWPNDRAVATASGAAPVLDKVTLADDVAVAIAPFTRVYATTARPRELTKAVLTPEHAMAEARGLVAAGERVAVLFGPERAGLENADIVQADAIVSVPVNPAFASLNLAQCVLLMAYEWGRQGADVAPEETALGKARHATKHEVEVLYQAYEAKLDAINFFWPDHKAEPMRQSLRNLFARMPMTDIDIRTLHGVLKALTEWRKS